MDSESIYCQKDGEKLQAAMDDTLITIKFIFYLKK